MCCPILTYDLIPPEAIVLCDWPDCLNRATVYHDEVWGAATCEEHRDSIEKCSRYSSRYELDCRRKMCEGTDKEPCELCHYLPAQSEEGYCAHCNKAVEESVASLAGYIDRTIVAAILKIVEESPRKSDGKSGT